MMFFYRMIISVLAIAVSPSILYAEHLDLVSFDNPPYSYQSEEGAPSGLQVEIVLSALKRAGVTATVSYYPWERSRYMVETGEADAVFPAFKNPQRENIFVYPQELTIHHVISLYVKKDSALDFDGDITLLREKRIGTVSTISYGLIFDSKRGILNLINGYSLEANFRNLDKGLLDMVISNSAAGDYTIRRLGLSAAVRKLPKHVDVVPSYLAFTRKRNHTEIIRKYDEALRQIKSGSEYRNILKKYQYE